MLGMSQQGWACRSLPYRGRFDSIAFLGTFLTRPIQVSLRADRAPLVVVFTLEVLEGYG